ncbi:GNAT family N-acetyltransferase [Actinotalea solisilvae]|uniref:GNAT family N-acetyltransferase n=1 Tax=Actinotalea solisilvae TaxID=2072922 RepID=UPI0027DEAABC|nr:GNAT family N-acetyltransferase [Actinotalea solisilvae]
MSTPPPGITVEPVPWHDDDAARLRDEQQAELAARYDGVEDIEPVLPPDEMLATVLVRLDGDAVACGSLRAAPAFGEAHGELKRMFVRPAARGRGLSRLVLRELERVAADAGLRRLLLETGVRQPEAIGLYRSAGYRRVENYGPYVTEPSSVCYARWLDPALATRAVLLNGSVGSGKSTVASAVGDLLQERGVPHAVLEVDALCDVWPPPAGDPFADAVALRNVRAVGRAAVDAGYRHLVLARVVERPEDRERYEAALDGADVRVVRLTAPEPVRVARLEARTPAGPSRAWHLARTVELEAVLAAAALDDAVVLNDGSPADAAREVLRALAW